nr:hypothetical protein [Klebsiella pneumoniae]
MLNESRDILAFLHTTVVANAGYAPIELLNMVTTCSLTLAYRC